MIEWYWAVAAFWLGGLCAVILVGLAIMANRDRFPPPTHPHADDPLADMPTRDDGTRAVNTIANFDVPDTDTSNQAWPLDRDKIHYRAKP